LQGISDSVPYDEEDFGDERLGFDLLPVGES
jgi:hypothetical protein